MYTGPAKVSESAAYRKKDVELFQRLRRN